MTGTWDLERGAVSWIIIDHKSQSSRVLTRTDLADEFLSIAAAEPEFRSPFPIGGTLGMDD